MGAFLLGLLIFFAALAAFSALVKSKQTSTTMDSGFTALANAFKGVFNQ